MMRHLAWLISASLALALPGLAEATDAYVTGNVNMRAGPDAGYPLVDQLQAGTGVDVQGCTQDWEWCDVIAFGNRGWVAGNFIEYEDQNQPVLLPLYGARIGIPIITFSIGTYWNHYYRNRPFYSRRDYWYQRPIVRRPPPRPMRNPYRGPVRHGNAPGHPPGISHARPAPPNRPAAAGQARPENRQPASRPSRPPVVHGQAQPASRPEAARVQPRHDERAVPNQPASSRKTPPAKHDQHDKHDKDDQHGH